MKEPVAWQISDGTIISGLKGVKPQDGWIPLYTHPVKESVEVVFDGEKYTTTFHVNELSDEEIHKIAQEHFHAGLGINPLDFARAVIKEITE